MYFLRKTWMQDFDLSESAFITTGILETLSLYWWKINI